MATGFNEKRYLEENPDVAEAVARGEFAAERHWELFGRKEKRKGAYAVDGPTAFDDAAYLAANPDVASAVSRGETTAQEHYLRYGQAEGRQATYVGTDARTAPAEPEKPALSQDVRTAIDRYANVADASGLRAGSLAESLARTVIEPYRDMLRKVRDGQMTEEEFRVQGAPIAQRRQSLLSQGSAAEFADAIRYAGQVTPDFLQSVSEAGAAAIQRGASAGTSAASLLSASDDATRQMQAAAEAAAERDRVRSRRGRGATLLTGVTGLDDTGSSVARRLLAGA